MNKKQKLEIYEKLGLEFSGEEPKIRFILLRKVFITPVLSWHPLFKSAEMKIANLYLLAYLFAEYCISTIQIM